MKSELLEKIQTLNRRVWENRLKIPAIDAWLSNFCGKSTGADSEKLHALYLLSQFMYFGNQQIRQLIRAMYRDLYQYPIIESIRRENSNTRDLAFIKRHFFGHLQTTRFLGLGNPSESGCHILYYFRQMNGLPKDLFVQSHELLGTKDNIEIPALHFVLIDDFCGSGETALKAAELVRLLRSNHPRSQIDHFALFGCESGLQRVRSLRVFDRVEAVVEFDNTFRCFDKESRYFGPSVALKFTEVERTCAHYGSALIGAPALGFGDCQLLLAFHHNTPDNTLPIFWADQTACVSWSPLFPRYPKLSYK